MSEAEAASIALILDQEVRSSSRSLMNPKQHRGLQSPNTGEVARVGALETR